MLSIIVLLIVFLLIAIRQIDNVKLQIWQIMLGGSIAVLATGQITFASAWKAINLDVILFLFSMFVIGQALEESSYLSNLSYRLFKRTKSVDHLVLIILYCIGITSAFLMNDTLAIIGTPIVLLLAKKHNICPKMLLLALAFAVTIGSVMSPIGNPQNLLIAINGNISNPFITFFKYLLIPTMINLYLTYLLLKYWHKEKFHPHQLNHIQEPIKDEQLAKLSKISLGLIAILITIKIVTIFFAKGFDFRLTYIALISAIPILFSPKRFEIIKKIDWCTLIFFTAMFVLMESVWEENFFQQIITSANLNIASITMIFIISVILSQLISNVPLVALYLPMLMQAGASTKEMVALAAGSTIAGNLFILGAASNVIIIQNAEMKTGETLTFMEFAKIGIPLTIINLAVYGIFLIWM